MAGRFLSSGAASTTLALVSLLACDEPGDPEPASGVSCGLVEQVALPGPGEVIAVDRAGGVHVASSSRYWVRAAGADFAEQDLSFGEPYAADPHLMAWGDEIVVAHAGDGVRVARGSAAAWTTMFWRPAVQCSGNPYIDQAEISADGTVILESSEGLHRVREGAELEPLPRADHWAVDGAGLLAVSTGETLTLTDAGGETILQQAFDRVPHIAVAPDGRALVLLEKHDDPRVWQLHRTADGVWASQATELLSWSESPCPDDPAIGTRCQGSSAFVQAAKIFPTADSFTVLIALDRNLSDVTYACHPTAGGFGGCYVGWAGDYRSEHEIFLVDATATAPAVTRILENLVEEDGQPFNVDAAQSETGDVHVVAGSTYAHFGCSAAD